MTATWMGAGNRRSAALAFALLAAAGFPEGATGAPAVEGDLEFFESRVRPVLSVQCHSCHGPEIETPFAGLRLDSRQALLEGGDSGPAIVPGDPGSSRLIQVLLGKPVLMPPTGRLDSEAVEDLAAWVRMGAPWPDEAVPGEGAERAFDLEARRQEHWAWQPVSKVEPPEVADTAWPSSPIDRFLLRGLEERDLRPADPADRRTLIRRLSFDLTGLPPAPSEVEEFVRDRSPDAYVRLVRRMLDSDHFGERWARHWMDLVRYADSHGSEGDPKVAEAWQYRDYLVRALNADVPYDQLVREHLAGDLLDDPRIDPVEGINESMLGTAHLRVVELGYQPVDPWVERVKWTDNQIDVISKAFLGLTVSCARCHDHKFDAISQEDYYALFGVLYGARPTMRAVDAPAVLRRNETELRDLKSRIREKVADAWIAESGALGERIRRGEDVAVRRAEEEAACDESSPLHAWMTLSDQGAEGFGEAWNRLRADWERRIESRAARNQEDFERIWDLSGADYARWISHGAGTNGTPSPPGEFHVRHEGELVLEGIYPGGAYTHLLTTKHAGVMQSPRFEIESDYISVKVLGGDFSFARLIVENYPLPGGGIYHQRYSPRSDRMQWAQWKTEFWKGFTGYIEFTTREDSTNFVLDPIDARKKPRPERPKHGRSAIGAAAVAFHARAGEPRPTVEPVLYFLDAEAPDSPADLPQVLSSQLAVAAADWRDGRLDERQAAFLDYFARIGLLPREMGRIPGIRPLIEEYRRLEAEVPVPRRFPGIVEESSPDQPLLVRGDPGKPGDPVPRRLLKALGGKAYENPRTVRLRLAEEMASPSNPLAARVMANRIWGRLFGRGIVATPDNFGALGERPSHPELLDYVAGRFVDGGWSIKGLVETLVTTSAYRMGSAPSPEALELDPSNALLQHMPVRRLEAEAIRDAVLAVSGRLDTAMFGGRAASGGMYEEGRGGDGSEYGDDRRSVYQQILRNRTNPFLEVFDQPTPSTTRGRRDETNVPAQSLAMMNSPFVASSAEAWGRRLAEGEGHSVESRVSFMYAKALGRPPTSRERSDATGFVAALAQEEGLAERSVLGEPKVWSRLAHALFNFKEFIYVR